MKLTRTGPSRSPAVGAMTPVALAAQPHRGRRPADAALIEASVQARLLGVRLLTLEATIVLVPAEVATPSSNPPPLRARARARPSGAPRARPDAVGRGLAEAVRSLNEGAELLAEARRAGPG